MSGRLIATSVFSIHFVLLILVLKGLEKKEKAYWIAFFVESLIESA